MPESVSTCANNKTILLAHSFYMARDTKQRDRCRPYAPHATLLAAAVLRRAGYEVRFFDATFAASTDAFAATIAQARPQFVMLLEDTFNFLTKMCTESRRQDALAMIRAAGAAGARVIASGPDASDHPTLYFAAGAEAVIAGEAEFAIEEVASALSRNTPLSGIGGLILPSKTGAPVATAPRPWTRNLDALPYPAWDLVDVEAYRAAWRRAHGHFSWNMAASRGCPYACNWCAKPTFGRRYAQRSPESLAEELSQVKRSIAPDHIWFADDIFGMTGDWLARFALEVSARDARIPFMIQSRANLIDAATCEALAEAGCTEIWLGIESGSQRILDAMDKGITIAEARHATRTLRQQGIRTGWFLQLGYPGEMWEDILRTRDLVRDERPDEIGVSVAYPLPGTKFHARVVKELGLRQNWVDTADLAMLFEGTFDTAFYREVRNLLHVEVDSRAAAEDRWQELAARAARHLSEAPLSLEAAE